MKLFVVISVEELTIRFRNCIREFRVSFPSFEMFISCLARRIDEFIVSIRLLCCGCFSHASSRLGDLVEVERPNLVTLTNLV